MAEYLASCSTAATNRENWPPLLYVYSGSDGILNLCMAVLWTNCFCSHLPQLHRLRLLALIASNSVYLMAGAHARTRVLSVLSVLSVLRELSVLSVLRLSFSLVCLVCFVCLVGACLVRQARARLRYYLCPRVNRCTYGQSVLSAYGNYAIVPRRITSSHSAGVKKLSMTSTSSL